VPGVDINVQDQHLNTPLHRACVRGNSKIIEILLQNHANPNIKNVAGRTPLHYALEQSHTHILELLIAHGADINEMAFDKSPVYIAVYYGNVNALEILLSNNANAGDRDAQLNDTPLHIAAERGYYDIVRRLINARVTIDPVNVNGDTPLSRAVEQGKCEVVPLLIEAGANTEIKVGPKKGTLLHLTVDNHDKECAEFLLKGYAKVNALNEDDETTLYVATKMNLKDFVELLLDYKADKNVGKDPRKIAGQQLKSFLGD